LQLGFSLKELSEILRTRDNGGAPCHHVLNEIDSNMEAFCRSTRRYCGCGRACPNHHLV
jgi:hypothetical protein